MGWLPSNTDWREVGAGAEVLGPEGLDKGMLLLLLPHDDDDDVNDTTFPPTTPILELG
jgi:hypothetical protein